MANLLLAGAATVLPNDVLVWHSWAVYGVQALTLLPYAARRAYYTCNLFQPSLFVLTYFLVNLTLGAWLVPRSYGFNKEYAPVAQAIETYGVMVPYLLLANVVLFFIACRTTGTLARTPGPGVTYGEDAAPRRVAFGWPVEVACLAGFVVVSSIGAYNAFSFQLGLAVVHLGEVARRRARHRALVYTAYLLVMVAMNYEDKREIAMLLFLVIFLESFHARTRLRLTALSVAGYVGVAATFLLLVLTASILRGYGEYDVASPLDAALAIPQYVGSDIFIDGLTDNLELNYCYGAAITSIDLTLRGQIPYQFGASIWKVLMLPVPRDLFPDKPESVMLIFTRVFMPTLYANDGSLPVISSSEMFVNYGVFGLLPFALIWLAVDWCYVRLHRSTPGTFAFCSCVFATISVLMFARGSGLEQYVLTYLLGAPLLLLAGTVGGRAEPRGRLFSGPRRLASEPPTTLTTSS